MAMIFDFLYGKPLPHHGAPTLVKGGIAPILEIPSTW